MNAEFYAVSVPTKCVFSWKKLVDFETIFKIELKVKGCSYTFFELVLPIGVILSGSIKMGQPVYKIVSTYNLSVFCLHTLRI